MGWRSALLSDPISWFIGVVLGLYALGSLVSNIESYALAFYFHPIVIKFFGGMLLARVAATWRFLHEGWISIVACVRISVVVSMIAFVVVERRMTHYLNQSLP